MGHFRPLYLFILVFSTVNSLAYLHSKYVQYKILLDSNRGHLVSEAIGLPTVPQPLPFYCISLNWSKPLRYHKQLLLGVYNLLIHPLHIKKYAESSQFLGDGRDNGVRIDDRCRKRFSRSRGGPASHQAVYQEPDPVRIALGHDERLFDRCRRNSGKWRNCLTLTAHPWVH